WGDWGPDRVETIGQLLIAARSIPEVESAALVSAAPFSDSHDTSRFDRPGSPDLEFESISVGDAFRHGMKFPIGAGPGLSAEDDGAAYYPVVINQRLARDLFGAASPIGKPLDKAEEGRPERRIVGVVADFRKNGEFSAPGNFVMFRANPLSP